MKPLTYRAAGVDIEAGAEAVRRIGPVARSTFRMGIGYVVIVRPGAADSVSARLAAAGEEVCVIGEVVAGERGVELVG
jgi:phosphoribosylaminoimidazole (AIR) synthetase